MMFIFAIRVAWQTHSHEPCAVLGDGLVFKKIEAKILRCPFWVSEIQLIVESEKSSSVIGGKGFQALCYTNRSISSLNSGRRKCGIENIHFTIPTSEHIEATMMTLLGGF